MQFRTTITDLTAHADDNQNDTHTVAGSRMMALAHNSHLSTHTSQSADLIFFTNFSMTHLCILYEIVGKQRLESDHGGKQPSLVILRFYRTKYAVFTYW